MVERHPSVLNVVGSSPISRSKYSELIKKYDIFKGDLLFILIGEGDQYEN